MEFFLRPENEEIWSQVQDLASKGDVIAIQSYVLEAQRLTSTLRLARFPTQKTKVEDIEVQPGDILVLNAVSAPLKSSQEKEKEEEPLR